MGKINWNRVILGGLVTGVIINIFEFVLNGVVLAKDMEAAMTALGGQVGGSQLGMFVVWGSWWASSPSGFTRPFDRATVPSQRPACAPGPAVWGLGYFLAAATPIALHFFSGNIMAIGLAVGLV